MRGCEVDDLVAHRDACAMRRLYNILGVMAEGPIEPLMTQTELAFVRAYRDAVTLWQELGGGEAEREQFRIAGGGAA